MENIKWTSEITDCDICKKPMGENFVDGNTIYGDWALMCRKCHTKYGLGLGTGRGQKYSTSTRELIEGGLTEKELAD